jgi:phosphatidate cytidylyltransferase
VQPAPRGEPPAEPSSGGPRGRNLPVAIATGLALAGAFFAALFTSSAAFLALVLLVLLTAQQELYAALARRGGRPATLLGLAAGALVVVGAYWRGAQALTFGLVATVVGAFGWYLAERDRREVTAGIAATVLGVAYVPVLGAHAILIRALPDGPALVVAVIGAVAFYDIGAYAAGSLLGRHRIAPAVSPSKTWEGAAGATALVFLLAVAVGPRLGPLDLGSSLALAAAVSVAAPLGDLAESLIKRDLDVKDMGTLLPGHGGALDRIDALLFAAPAAYWLFRGLLG